MTHPYKGEADNWQQSAQKRYASGGDVSAATAVHKHERHDHKGEPLTTFNGGGRVGGAAAPSRFDKRARGGRTGPARVNIVISTGGGAAERQQAQQQGMLIGAKLASSAAPPSMPPRPMMPPGAAPLPGGPPGGPPLGGPPPGAPAIRPPMKRGGAVYLLGKGGAGSGLGRLQKSGLAEERIAVKAHTRRRGGRV